MKYVSKCILCNSINLTNLKRYTTIVQRTIWGTILIEKFLKSDRLNYFICYCEKCGLLFLNPRFSDEDYKTFNEGEPKKILTDKGKKYNLKRAERVYKIITKNFNPKDRENKIDKPDILDYGGGAGYILHPFINKFNTHLLDFNHWNLDKNIKYLGQTFSDVKDNKKFDVILCLRVLEHVNKPKELLQAFKKHLNDDGIIFLQVPLGCIWEWRGKPHYFVHINYFSSESLYKCFKLAGLNVIDLRIVNLTREGGEGLKINIIATNSKKTEINFSKVISTKRQMSKISYIFLSFLRKKSFEPKNLMKKLKFLRKRIIKKLIW